jgi:molybdenum cofactor biosynthesis protein B
LWCCDKHDRGKRRRKINFDFIYNAFLRFLFDPRFNNKMNQFIPLNIAVLVVSDTRTESDDISGKLLVELAEAAGHRVVAKKIVPDDIYQIRAVISNWIAQDDVPVVITTGGTGVTGRDGTPEAILPLLDKVLDGFGETFRMLSYQDIKTSTIQSRALAGVANATYLFCLPGSSGACRTAWDLLIKDQLDHRTKPCNLVQLMPRLREA